MGSEGMGFLGPCMEHGTLELSWVFWGYGRGYIRVYIGAILGLYWDNGKGLGFRIFWGVRA